LGNTVGTLPLFGKFVGLCPTAQGATPPHVTALDIFGHVDPFFKTKVTENTVYGIKASLQTLQYTTVCGAIFNDFLMEQTTKIIRENIDAHKGDMKEQLSFYNKWIEEIEASKQDSDNFISLITYQILRSSVCGFLSTVVLRSIWTIPKSTFWVCSPILVQLKPFSQVFEMQGETPHKDL
jgi:hypothetical protein